MKYYTGVGSRQTPDSVLELMEALAFRLAEAGWCLRSGGADGADTAFENGACASYGGPSRNANMEIYLPWNGFNGHEEYDYRDAYQNVSRYQNRSVAEKLASTIHPAWPSLTRGAKALHTRNMYQVLGKDLDSPSCFLVCYAEPTKSGVKGGTNSAFQLAKQNSVKTYNLFDEEALKRIRQFVYPEEL